VAQSYAYGAIYQQYTSCTEYSYTFNKNNLIILYVPGTNYSYFRYNYLISLMLVYFYFGDQNYFYINQNFEVYSFLTVHTCH